MKKFIGKIKHSLFDRKHIVTALVLLGLLGTLTGCGEKKEEETAEITEKTEEETVEEARTIKLGLTGVIYEDIWNPIKEQLAEEGINLELVQFSDFSLPNNALDSGEIDINAFQHHAYFNNDVEKNGYQITPIADTFIIAMNLYSEKISDVSELKDGDTIAIPDDASNGGRALKLLESAGVITIAESAGANPTVSDIENYNVNVTIQEIAAANAPSIIPDVTAAVVNGNYALDYGIDPGTAIFKETEYDDDSYFCLIAVRSDEADNPDYKRIVELFQSEQTKQIFKDTFQGYFVPAWEQ